MSKLIITDIEWDTDGKEIDLPTKVDLSSYLTIDGLDSGEPTISDILSDIYGWSVLSCCYLVSK